MPIRRIALALLICLLGVSAAAEVAEIESISFTNRAHRIVVDREGFAWVGTPGGLLRWNPSEGTHDLWTAADGLPDNWISDVVMAPDGSIWVAMATWAGGMAVYRDGAWVSFDRSDGLPRDFVHGLAVDAGGALWAATADGLAVLTLDAEQKARASSLPWSEDPTAEHPQSVAVDTRGRVWLWTPWGNLVLLDPAGSPHDTRDDTWSVIPFERLPDAGQILGLVPDPWGRVWISQRDVMSVIEGDRIGVFTSGDGFPRDPGSAVAFDETGRLWIPTARRTVAIFEGAETPFDRSDDRFESVPVSWDVSGWGIQRMAFGPEDELWLAAGTDGALRWRHQGTLDDVTDDRWEIYLAESPLPSADVKDVAFTADGAWVACGGGLVHQDSSGVWHDALAATVYSVDVSGTTVWAGTWGGLVAVDVDDGAFITTAFTTDQGLPTDHIGVVRVDDVGRVWFELSDLGVAVLDPAGTPHAPEDDALVLFTDGTPLSERDIGAIVLDGRGRAWFGLLESGAVGLDFAGTLDDPLDDIWMVYDATTEPSIRSVYSLGAGGEGRLWMGGCGTCMVFDSGERLEDPGDDRSASFAMSNCVTGFAVAPDGIVWMANNWDGVRRFDPAGTPFDPADDSWIALRAADGLLDNRTEWVALAPDGRLWVGTDAGLSIVRLDLDG